MSNYNNRNGVVKDHGHDEHKPMRYSKDSFVKELIGKVVRITLLNGKEVQGKLTSACAIRRYGVYFLTTLADSLQTSCR